MTQQIPITQIDPPKRNPRKTFNDATIQELADSIKATNGVIQAIIVRPIGDRFEVVAGDRRYRASLLAGMESIKCDIQEETLDDRVALERALIENILREDMNPLEEGEAYRALMDEHGKTAQEIATNVGKHISYINRRMQMTTLTPEVKEAFMAGDLEITHLRLLMPLPPQAQHDMVTWLLYNYSWHWEDGSQERVRRDRKPGPTETGPKSLADYIESEYKLYLKNAPFDSGDPDLVPTAGSCIMCPKRSGATAHLEDNPGRDTCFDKKCWEVKRLAHVDRIADMIRLEGQEPVVVKQDQYAGDRTDQAGRRTVSHTLFKQNENGKATALVFDKKNPLGKLVRGDVSKSSSGGKSKVEIAHEKAIEKHKIDLALEYRSRLRTAIEDNLPRHLDLDTLRLVAKSIYDNNQASVLLRFFRVCDVDALNNEECVRRAFQFFEVATESEIVRAILIREALFDLMQRQEWYLLNGRSPESAEAVARSYGIEPDSILAAVRAELPPPPKPGAKPKKEKPVAIPQAMTREEFQAAPAQVQDEYITAITGVGSAAAPAIDQPNNPEPPATEEPFDSRTSTDPSIPLTPPVTSCTTTALPKTHGGARPGAGRKPKVKEVATS
jgi:ParB/RepB/Spo0J family partition protein